MTETRAERADRILDVAAELLHRFGYRRLTMDDIAEQAGVGKGTVYLHWKTREALFVAVILREFIRSSEGLAAGVRADPNEVRLHRLIRAQYRDILRRPLLRALYTADPDVLGKLLKAVQGTVDPRHHTATQDYLALLAAHNMLRSDISLPEVFFVFHATLEGFLTSSRPTDTLDDDATADLLAELLRRALEPETEPSQQVLAEVATRTIELLAESADADRAVLHRAY